MTRLPLLPRKYLPRQRLWDSLDEATEGAMTLLVAPVGAGKTLGVVGWLRAGRRPGAVWVAASADLSVDSIRRLTSQKGPDGLPRLLVVDDAQTLSRAVLAHLDERLGDDPHSLRLLLISRWDLPLTRLVPELLGDLTILRGSLLRLEPEEAAALVAEHARTDSAEVCEVISARAHGWCAAVVLAARAVAGTADPVAAARRLMSGSTVVDRVASEVFAALTARQRHLLLCLADDDVVSPALARHLSHDEDAGRLLEALESTGLLVSGYVDARHTLEHDLHPDVEPSDPGVTYRLHPLLVEVARRRLAVGGVDVERARATVRRAVALDLERGEQGGALRRLIAVGAHDTAAQLVVDRGVTLVLAGDAEALTPYVQHHAAEVGAEPRSCLPVALHRWLTGDPRNARHWLHRLSVQARDERRLDDAPEIRRVELATARLMRARFGDEALADAVTYAEEVLVHPGPGVPTDGPLLPLVRLGLGTAQLQLGRSEDADPNLTEAMRFGRSSGLTALGAEAASELALSQFLQGREHACLDLARDVLRSEVPRPYAATTRAGVLLARKLALLQAVVDARPDGAGAFAGGPEPVEPSHENDVVSVVLSRLLTSRRLLLRGMVTDAERALDVESVRLRRPRLLQVTVLLEQVLQSSLARDAQHLTLLERELVELEAPGEAAYVAALRAEGVGDTRTALDHFAAAIDGSTCLQPPVVALALTGRAQLLYGDGRTDQALADLRAALTATEVRRNALPFLGWSRHGSSMGTVLRAVLEVTPSEWGTELLRSVDGRAGIASLAGTLTATPSERAQVSNGVVLPNLSSRERDVLHELARGARYADIAANLFVSQNTVKTHVSSLYAKLAVSRRSDALAVARTLALL